MTDTAVRATGSWVRCGDVLSYTSLGGTVVLPADGRTAVTLSAAEHALWAATAEPATVETLAALIGADAQAAGATAARLARLGIVREVP